MTAEQYRKVYEALEAEAKAGRRSWVSVCAQIATLSIEFGAAQEQRLQRAHDAEQVEP